MEDDPTTIEARNHHPKNLTTDTIQWQHVHSSKRRSPPPMPQLTHLLRKTTITGSSLHGSLSAPPLLLPANDSPRKTHRLWLRTPSFCPLPAEKCIAWTPTLNGYTHPVQMPPLPSDPGHHHPSPRQRIFLKINPPRPDTPPVAHSDEPHRLDPSPA
jgi:hypothetical protein